MKKAVVVLLVLALCAGCAFAEEEATRKVKEGTLTYSNMSPEEYGDFLDVNLSQNVWNIYVNNHPAYSAYIKTNADIHETFDTVTEMVMALDAGKVDRIEFPEHVGKYFLRQADNANKYVPYWYAQGVNYYLSMGFSEGNKWFGPFNAVIKAMNEDDTLLLLKAKYVGKANADMKPITFEKFPDAETVKIAVTGDMPPIDYIAADGTPAGFNTAMLAEIARRLKVNVELVSVNAGARAAALSSGRADGVFWFWYDKQTKTPRDVPAGVELTEPYYTYDTFMYVGKRLH
ncbi:MAG: transporter substrate-binding domain-containing protein [Synergistaceae bacterium]|nr:transporter substrate-binding domain-containing protein [Synergistaceae bacterium]